MIPEQLKDLEFRFFLAGSNKKTPIEKLWNSENNYMFFEKKLLNHLVNGGNIGVCTGYGRLIVIDFDDAEYQKQKENMLPKTFTCKSAGKGLKHFYYRLEGNMIESMGIGMENRLCDILAAKKAVIIPPSVINRKIYSVVEDVAIADISHGLLSEIFLLKDIREYHGRMKFNTLIQPEKIQESIRILLNIGITRVGERHFKCPLHNMNGKTGNLWVGHNALLYCFHCCFYGSVDRLIKKMDKSKVII